MSLKTPQSVCTVMMLFAALAVTVKNVSAQTPEIFKGAVKGKVGNYAEKIDDRVNGEVKEIIETVESKVKRLGDSSVDESNTESSKFKEMVTPQPPLVDRLKIEANNEEPLQVVPEAVPSKIPVDVKPSDLSERQEEEVKTVPPQIDSQQAIAQAVDLMHEVDPAKAEMMKKWQAYATPNDNHSVLEPMVGQWQHEVKWWMSPDEEPDVSQGTNTVSWIMGRRFVQNEVDGMSMGQPFSGMALVGYDNAKQVYNTVWIDSMATGMMKGKGRYDAQNRELIEQGIYTCPFEGQKSYRAVTKFIDSNHYQYEMYTTEIGTHREFKSMEVHYTRKEQ